MAAALDGVVAREVEGRGARLGGGPEAVELGDGFGDPDPTEATATTATTIATTSSEATATRRPRVAAPPPAGGPVTALALRAHWPRR